MQLRVARARRTRALECGEDLEIEASENIERAIMCEDAAAHADSELARTLSLASARCYRAIACTQLETAHWCAEKARVPEAFMSMLDEPSAPRVK
jgi:hypothetical protein